MKIKAKVFTAAIKAARKQGKRTGCRRTENAARSEIKRIRTESVRAASAPEEITTETKNLINALQAECERVINVIAPALNMHSDEGAASMYADRAVAEIMRLRGVVRDVNTEIERQRAGRIAVTNILANVLQRHDASLLELAENAAAEITRLRPAFCHHE